MQTRPNFHGLQRTLESTLISPCICDAVEELAGYVPKRTGPNAAVLGSAIFVEERVWKFKSIADARRFAEQMETYFRNFDANYRIKALDGSSEAENERLIRFM